MKRSLYDNNSVLIALLLLTLCLSCSGCTTFAVGKAATLDGSVFATHTNDGGGTTDPRLVKIPAREYPIGSMRPIYASPENYPRYVGFDRQAESYYPENCDSSLSACKEFQPIGYIPQVEHTYAYIEQTYGALNEKQVGLTESTCSGVFVANAINDGGKALLSIDQLSQIAMERASSAREAIIIMGNLSQSYGFYGESASFEGGSESLFVTDPNEAWAFHILADPTGTSSIWVAARIPDDSVAVVANMFSIREVNLSDPINFLGRHDMWDIAIEHGLYKDGDAKDFTKTFSDGEYSHKFYSGRRMWGVFRLLAPSAMISPEYDNLKEDQPYPFAIKVDQLVKVQDMMSILRDWYAGTNYSTGSSDQILAGGAFTSPDRYSTYSSTSGNWERTIAIYRSSDTYIVQSRAWLPDHIGGILWFGPHAAHGTAYVPMMTIMTSAPDCLSYGWQGVYNLSSSYWTHRIILNIAQVKFSYMIDDIRVLQDEVESKSVMLIDKLSSEYHGLSGVIDFKDATIDHVTAILSDNAEYVRQQFMILTHKLLFKYADGYINYWQQDDVSDDNKKQESMFVSSSLSYPQWWLDEVGYADGPPNMITTPTAKKLLYPLTRTSSTTSGLMGIAEVGAKIYVDEEDKMKIWSDKKKPFLSMRECIVNTCMNIMQDHQYERCVKSCARI